VCEVAAAPPECGAAEGQARDCRGFRGHACGARTLGAECCRTKIGSGGQMRSVFCLRQLQHFWPGSWSMFVALALVFAGSNGSAAALQSNGVAWESAANERDIRHVFARARSENKPVLLYWGATWCPPCNRLQATLFNRQDFATVSRSFVAVHIDGDLPGAQKLGQLFKASGYPTLILYSADGKEITRVPSEVDPPQALAVLELGLAGGRPVKAVLADALSGRTLAPDEWRMLAFYSWETDDEHLVPSADMVATLVRLAVAAPAADRETANRLWLKALAASDDGKGLKADVALLSRVLAVLHDPRQARAQMDVLVDSAAEIARALRVRDVAGNASMMEAFDAALARMQLDRTLSRADRMDALTARVDLARIDIPKDAVRVDLPASLVSELRSQVVRYDREITDRYERQAVITSAAYALADAGLWADSDTLLRANLARSDSPYYLMIELAGNARKLGRVGEALHWYAQAYEASRGPATRLQWGSRYLAALVELAPVDSVRIESLASQLLTEAASDSGAFDGRNRRSLKQASSKLLAWNAAGAHAATLRRLRLKRDALCAKVDGGDAQRAGCRKLLETAGGLVP
jgi:thiol-disulfide isomerase/thioredoxin